MSDDRPVPAMLEHARPRAPVDLMNWPWFSLAKIPRTAPIHYQGKTHSVHIAPVVDGCLNPRKSGFGRAVAVTRPA
ncbi:MULTISPECIES: replication initiator protein A [unclassified Acidiphilium]|uniref:replication initiator protein A n=1 Tax=unclassified Acidiphilium TaxID=2617493 RepID=UPI00257C7D08|nr:MULTISPECIES: replication initiator protein A [unclassified Acidiphilium]